MRRRCCRAEVLGRDVLMREHHELPCGQADPPRSAHPRRTISRRGAPRCGCSLDPCAVLRAAERLPARWTGWTSQSPGSAAAAGTGTAPFGKTHETGDRT